MLLNRYTHARAHGITTIFLLFSSTTLFFLCFLSIAFLSSPYILTPYFFAEDTRYLFIKLTLISYPQPLFIRRL